jgi:hypothetical protein
MEDSLLDERPETIAALIPHLSPEEQEAAHRGFLKTIEDDERDIAETEEWLRLPPNPDEDRERYQRSRAEEERALVDLRRNLARFRAIIATSYPETPPPQTNSSRGS